MRRGRKTLEAQGDPFRRGLPTLQTSLTHPELPHKTPTITRAKICFAFLIVGVWWGSFRLGREVIFSECGYRTRLVSGMRLEVILYVSAEIPPAGAPSGFDSAAILDFSA